ncbi:MAG: hypothetical protein MZV64_49270 [Ignavibacteriales bacterium]|nr:hypothetical protein [Ignavibacteriales bacterium]
MIVAFTVAGLERVVVSEEMIPLVEKAGLKPVEDFRGTFTGQTDVQIYAGGFRSTGPAAAKSSSSGWVVAGTMMKPGVADWGHLGAFFTDLAGRRDRRGRVCSGRQDPL